MTNISAGSVLTDWMMNRKMNQLVSLNNFAFTNFNDGSNRLQDVANSVITGLTFANTNAYFIYVSIVDDGAGNYHINLYKGAGHAAGDMIAHTASYAAGGYKALTADNASGVGGYIYVTLAGTDAGDDIYIICGWMWMKWSNRFMALDDIP